jgi:hypothetical protein
MTVPRLSVIYYEAILNTGKWTFLLLIPPQERYTEGLRVHPFLDLNKEIQSWQCQKRKSRRAEETCAVIRQLTSLRPQPW